MKIKNNKKGVLSVGLITGVVLIALLLVGGALAIFVPNPFIKSNLADSDVTLQSGCEPNVDTYSFEGKLVVVDGSIFQVEPEIVGLTSFNFRKLSFFEDETFDYEVSLFNKETNDLIDEFKGSSAIERSLITTNEGVLVPFAFTFDQLDNNCDDKIDDTTFLIKAKTIETNEASIFIDEDTFEETVVFRGGTFLK
jgi:hypothetical protein